ISCQTGMCVVMSESRSLLRGVDAGMHRKGSVGVRLIGIGGVANRIVMMCAMLTDVVSGIAVVSRNRNHRRRHLPQP
ncbi:MAG: hypothetical protein WCT01_02935, partial [Candidatus Shapirobacteria bacterium]